ncbi:MAG: hypothetical protein Hyperionvirus21_14 [Hyperionvirus sp.]|uniref:Fe2OG dioxygenase domain-containing protein n=1 Tax=Hyperionvirus sp. TaxID=2487770 RepID=A0A3G5AAK2_9VIRU|nr:MAG: hypothetical protein Hyperionvirus21_14 [Hyperionvirus sp.]
MTDAIVKTLLSTYNASLLDDDLKLVYINNLFTDVECDHLIGLAYKISFNASLTTDGKSKDRTSHSAYIPKNYDKTVQDVSERIAKLCDKKATCIEQLQVVKYEIGEQFAAHCDYFSEPYIKKMGWSLGGQRQFTFFVYLNTVDRGGETEFTTVGLEFKPNKGHAIFWENCKDPKIGNIRSMHRGKPPLSNLKFGLNIWISFDQ